MSTQFNSTHVNLEQKQVRSGLQRPANPCVRNCCLDDNDVCLGCFRTLDEILAWRSLTAEQRKAVMLEVEKRRAKNRLIRKN